VVGVGTTLPAYSAPFLPALVTVVEAGGGIEPLSDVGLVDGWRTADAGEIPMGIVGDGETWRGSVREGAGFVVAGIAGG